MVGCNLISISCDIGQSNTEFCVFTKKCKLAINLRRFVVSPIHGRIRQVQRLPGGLYFGAITFSTVGPAVIPPLNFLRFP